MCWMGYFIDPESGILICPDEYYTDGVYVWPGYFSYFLKKYPAWNLDKTFLEHVEVIGSMPMPVPAETVRIIEKELSVFLQHTYDGS